MLYELRISTNDGVEFASFTAQWQRFMEQWNATVSAPIATPSVSPGLPPVSHQVPANVPVTAAPPAAVTGRDIQETPAAAVLDAATRPGASDPEAASADEHAAGAPEAQKRKRRTKAEMEAARAAGASAELPRASTNGAAGVSAPNGKQYTLEDV